MTTAIRKGASTLSPTDTIEEYDKSMKFMNELLPTLKDRVIVMSHHATNKTEYQFIKVNINKHIICQ